MAFGLAPLFAGRMKSRQLRFPLLAAFRMWGMRAASIVPTLVVTAVGADGSAEFVKLEQIQKLVRE